MTSLVFLATLAGLLLLLETPSLLLRLIRLLPLTRMAALKDQTQERIRRDLLTRTWRVRATDAARLVRVGRMLVVASSVMAAIALFATAMLTWHTAELMLVMR